jgi:hypothetical protein
MQRKNNKNKPSLIATIIASVCIIVYLAALVFAAVQIYVSIDERRILADKEFYDLADKAASAAVLGFMNEPFQTAIEDAITSSRTMEGVIISGPNGEYAFERDRGAVITWVNNSPRFKSRFDLSRDPLYQPLYVEGLRNVNIQAVAGSVDYDAVINILKQTLIIVLASLILAFFTLLLEALFAKNRVHAVYTSEPRTTVPDSPDPGGFAENSPEEKGPRGLFTPNGNIGWEDYIQERLAAELHRCASYEQDLVFLVMEFKDLVKFDKAFYRAFADEAVNFFTLRDLIFEKGDRGISIIYPNIDLELGFAKAEEFHGRVLSKLARAFTSKTDLCIGLSSRSGRLIDAPRIIFEANQALKKAQEDPISHIVAFKSDPEKYRDFVKTKGLETQSH